MVFDHPGFLPRPILFLLPVGSRSRGGNPGWAGEERFWLAGPGCRVREQRVVFTRLPWIPPPRCPWAAKATQGEEESRAGRRRVIQGEQRGYKSKLLFFPVARAPNVCSEHSGRRRISACQPQETGKLLVGFISPHTGEPLPKFLLANEKVKQMLPLIRFHGCFLPLASLLHTSASQQSRLRLAINLPQSRLHLL